MRHERRSEYRLSGGPVLFHFSPCFCCFASNAQRNKEQEKKHRAA
jgi:hypothetical protein